MRGQFRLIKWGLFVWKLQLYKKLEVYINPFTFSLSSPLLSYNKDKSKMKISGKFKKLCTFLCTPTKNPRKSLIYKGLILNQWCGPGSNRRHKDFQSFALPTELPHQLFFPLYEESFSVLFRPPPVGGYRTNYFFLFMRSDFPP